MVVVYMFSALFLPNHYTVLRENHVRIYLLLYGLDAVQALLGWFQGVVNVYRKWTIIAPPAKLG